MWALPPGSLTAGPHLLQVKLHRALLCLPHVLLHKQDSRSQGKPAGRVWAEPAAWGVCRESQPGLDVAELGVQGAGLGMCDQVVALGGPGPSPPHVLGQAWALSELWRARWA